MLTDRSASISSSNYMLFDREVLNEILKFQDSDMFLRGAISCLGFSSTEVEFKSDDRHSGSSSYNLIKLLSLATGSLISFSNKPLAIGVWIGLLISFISFIFTIKIFFQISYGTEVLGYPLQTAFLLLLFGVLFIVIGIIGIYVGRILRILQKRPRYIIEEYINIEK